MAQNVATPMTVRHKVSTNRVWVGVRQCRDPYHSPPVALPNA